MPDMMGTPRYISGGVGESIRQAAREGPLSQAWREPPGASRPCAGVEVGIDRLWSILSASWPRGYIRSLAKLCAINSSTRLETVVLLRPVIAAMSARDSGEPILSWLRMMERLSSRTSVWPPVRNCRDMLQPFSFVYSRNQRVCHNQQVSRYSSMGSAARSRGDFLVGAARAFAWWRQATQIAPLGALRAEGPPAQTLCPRRRAISRRLIRGDFNRWRRRGCSTLHRILFSRVWLSLAQAGGWRPGSCLKACSLTVSLLHGSASMQVDSPPDSGLSCSTGCRWALCHLWLAIPNDERQIQLITASQ